MTFESPLKILVKLLTTISARPATSTLTKLPMVSSTTMTKPYWSAKRLNATKSGLESNGLPGNSVNRAVILGVEESCEARRASRAGISCEPPVPKK